MIHVNTSYIQGTAPEDSQPTLHRSATVSVNTGLRTFSTAVSGYQAKDLVEEYY